MAVSKEAEEVIVEDAFTEDDCPKCPPQGAPVDVYFYMATLLMHSLCYYHLLNLMS